MQPCYIKPSYDLRFSRRKFYPKLLSLMASLSSRLSPSSASLNGFAMGRRPLAQSMAVLQMWGKSPNGSATCRVVCRNFASKFHRDPLHWSKRLRRLGIAYAASTAEKTIYDYTVKVSPAFNDFLEDSLKFYHFSESMNAKINDLYI